MHTKLKGKRVLPLCFMVWLAAAFGVSADDVVIVAHRDMAVDSLPRSELRDIFLGDRTQWSDGQPIVFFILKDGAVHEQFMKEHIKKTGTGFIRHWKRLSMTGKGRMPRAFRTEEELLSFVRQTPGAIGYVAANNADSSIRILPIR